MAVNPAERKRKLSKNLLLMKFMQRGANKSEQNNQHGENELVIDDEHWVRHNPLPQQTVCSCSFVIEPSYSVCENLSFGRRSYKGFNPEVEKICKAMDASQEMSESEKREQENTITDEDMALRYSSLSDTIRKKFMSKHDRSRADEGDAEMQQNDDDCTSTKKIKRTKKKFLKPQDL